MEWTFTSYGGEDRQPKSRRGSPASEISGHGQTHEKHFWNNDLDVLFRFCAPLKERTAVRRQSMTLACVDPQCAIIFFRSDGRTRIS